MPIRLIPSVSLAVSCISCLVSPHPVGSSHCKPYGPSATPKRKANSGAESQERSSGLDSSPTTSTSPPVTARPTFSCSMLTPLSLLSFLKPPASSSLTYKLGECKPGANQPCSPNCTARPTCSKVVVHLPEWTVYLNFKESAR